MLHQVLQEITNAKEPVSLTALSLRLGIERTALDEMLAYWVRKGRLKEDKVHSGEGHSAGSCGPACCGANKCSFTAKLPRRYSSAARKDKHLS